MTVKEQFLSVSSNIFVNSTSMVMAWFTRVSLRTLNTHKVDMSLTYDWD